MFRTIAKWVFVNFFHILKYYFVLYSTKPKGVLELVDINYFFPKELYNFIETLVVYNYLSAISSIGEYYFDASCALVPYPSLFKVPFPHCLYIFLIRSITPLETVLLQYLRCEGDGL